MKASVVVGLGFGDEGKGMTTDYLCSHRRKVTGDADTIVVRFNGGQQATHTVIRDGIKHSFSSYCSGTLQGIPSYISEYCCFYPPSVYGERKDLLKKGIDPVLYIHPLAKMTTPYDIAYNRMRESLLRHGSVGVGIGATFSRHDNNYKLHAMDIHCSHMLTQKLIQIGFYYESLLIDVTSEERNYYDSIVKEEFNFFYAALAGMDFRIKGYKFLKAYSNIIFEGGQGILLDRDFGIFPHVTYSYCTSRNAIEMCKQLGISDVSIHYVTRCYQTRHGNGWMSNEKELGLVNTDEEINVKGNWQGIFRTGELDTKLLNYALECDDTYSLGYKKFLHVTCLDQRPGYTFPVSKLSTPFEGVRYQGSPYVSSKNEREFYISAGI